MAGKRRGSGKGTAEAYAILAVVGIIGSLIIDIMKLAHYDEAFYLFQGTWPRHLLAFHIGLWPMLIAMTVLSFVAIVDDGLDCYFLYCFLFEILDIAYFIMFGYILFQPKQSEELAEEYKEQFNNTHTFESIIYMKLSNNTDYVNAVNHGMDKLKKDADYQYVPHQVMFYLCAIFMILIFVFPCIMCDCC